jgi:aldehyde:ferredoxin oxidoreductase
VGYPTLRTEGRAKMKKIDLSKKILRVDLSNKKISKEILDGTWTKKFLGGRGINSRLLFEEVPPSVEPFSPENRLIFGIGPLCGTLAPTTGRFTVTARSPLTGTLGDANAGGFWAPELRFAGYDHLIVQGISEEPCYLFIDGDNVELRKADHLWGKTTWDTDLMIKEELKDQEIQIASIGPAGENRIRFAAIINSLNRANGRCGMGAVMGSKKLKAVAIRGNKDVRVARPKEFIRAVKRAFEKVIPTATWVGTPLLTDFYNEAGCLGAYNWRQGTFDIDNICSEVFATKYRLKRKACWNCPKHCSGYFIVREGSFAGLHAEGAQYDTISGFGPKCGNKDMATILKAHTLCNQLGMDTISTSGTIAMAMELFEKEIINMEETNGIPLEWGNTKAIIELIYKIAKREGIGDILAEGEWRAAQKFGGPDALKYTMTIKKMESDGSNWRGLKGGALNHAVSSRGADHLRGLPMIRFGTEKAKEFAMETFGEKVYHDFLDETKTDGKAPVVIWCENSSALADAMGLCKFVDKMWFTRARHHSILPEELADLITTATGWEVSGEELTRIGERIVNLERAFLVRDGLSRKDDTLPEKYQEPLPDGPSKGLCISEEELDRMLNDYYDRRGWDQEGRPTKKTLVGLGLRGVADTIQAK